MKYLFLYLNVINNKFSGADYEIYSTYVRTFLLSKSIDTLQYINYHELNINSIIADIANSKSQKIVIYINEYNYYISKCIVNGVKKINGFKEFYCMGPNTQYIEQELSPEIAISKFMPSNIIDAANYLISELNVKDFLSIDECKKMHPYTQRVVPVSEIYNIGLLSSIGCYGKCSFCSYSKTDIFQFDIENLIKELRYIHNNKIYSNKIIWFYDDCFSITKERIKHICNEIIELNLEFRFWCCLRYDLLDQDILALLRQAGFTEIVVGLESASPNVLETLGKLGGNNTSEEYLIKIEDISLFSKQLGIHLVLSVNFGLPNEELEDAMKTLNYIASHTDNEYSINYMTAFPNSKLFDTDTKSNRIEKGITSLPHKTFYNQYNIEFVDRNLRYLQMMKSYVDSYEDNYLWKKTLQMITGIFSEDDIALNKLNYLEIDDITTTSNFIKEHLNIDAIICKKIDKIILNDSKIFCDNRKILKLNIENYNELIKFCYDNDIYVENIALYKEGDRKYLKVNNYYKTGEVSLDRCDTQANLLKLVAGYKLFCTQHLHDMESIKNMVFSNMCMFSNECAAYTNPRLSIHDGRCFICNSQHQVGGINHNVLTIKKNIKSLLKESNVCIAANDEIKEEIIETKKNHPLLYIYVNTICFVAYNFWRGIDNKEVIELYSSVNHDFSNNYLQVSDDFVLIIIRDVFIGYNAKEKIGFVANAQEKDILKMIFILKSKRINQTIVKKLEIKLKQYGVIQ